MVVDHSVDGSRGRSGTRVDDGGPYVDGRGSIYVLKVMFRRA